MHIYVGFLLGLVDEKKKWIEKQKGMKIGFLENLVRKRRTKSSERHPDDQDRVGACMYHPNAVRTTRTGEEYELQKLSCLRTTSERRSNIEPRSQGSTAGSLLLK